VRQSPRDDVFRRNGRNGVLFSKGLAMTGLPFSRKLSGALERSRVSALVLGAFLIVAGLFVAANAVTVTIASAVLFGIVLALAGIFEAVAAFSASHWRGVLLRVLLGALYALGGAVLISDPAGASALVTLLFATVLIAAGIVRAIHAWRYWSSFGPLLLLSSAFGIAAGLVILAKWPMSGLWALGLLIGIDLVLFGLWWVALGMRAGRSRYAA
jgi:uncharacterized membrane protein HdeD (DUF308 family)